MERQQPQQPQQPACPLEAATEDGGATGVDGAWRVLDALVRRAGAGGVGGVRARMLARGRSGSVWAAWGAWPLLRAALLGAGADSASAARFELPAEHELRLAGARAVAVKVQLLTRAVSEHDARGEEQNQMRAWRAWADAGAPHAWRVPAVLAAATVAREPSARERAAGGGAWTRRYRVTLMEYFDCAGRTLHELSHLLSQPSAPARAGLCERLRDALRAVWGAGVLHGDLHDSNVAVERGSEALVLLDWGLAIALRRAERRHMRLALALRPELSPAAVWCLAGRDPFERVMARRGIRLHEAHPDGPALCEALARSARHVSESARRLAGTKHS